MRGHLRWPDAKVWKNVLHHPVAAPAAVAFIALFITLISISPGKMIIGGDSAWPELNPAVAIGQRSTGWAEFAGLGRDSALYIPSVPIAAFDAVGEAIGLSPTGVNHLWMFLLIAIQGLGAVRLYMQLFGTARRAVLPIIFVGSAAFLNPYVLLTFHTPNPPLDICLAAAPFVFASAIAFLTTGRSRNFIEFAIWVVVAIPGNMNAAYVAEYVLVLSVIGAFALVKSRQHSVTIMRILASALVFFGLNLALWIPLYHFISTSFSLLSRDAQVYSADTLRVTSQFSPIQNVVRLVGGYLFFNPVDGAPYIPEGTSYVKNPFVVAATCIVPLLALSCWWFGRKSIERTAALVLTVCALAFAFLAKGTNDPLGALFAWLFQHVGAFQAYRDPYGKFGWLLLLCYVVLAGRTLAFAAEKWRRLGPLIYVVAFAAVGIAAYPILTGHLFYADARAAVPHRYDALGAWMQRQSPTSRFLQLPVPNSIFVKYKWGFRGAGVITNLSSRSLVSREFDYTQPGVQAIDNMAADHSHPAGPLGLARLLGLLGVTHTIGDSAMELSTFGEPEIEPPYTGPLPGTRVVARFGTIEVSAIEPSLLNKRVYAANLAVTGATNAQQMAVACEKITCRNAVFLPASSALGLDATPATFAFSHLKASTKGRLFAQQPPFDVHLDDAGKAAIVGAKTVPVNISFRQDSAFAPTGVVSPPAVDTPCNGILRLSQAITKLPGNHVLAIVVSYKAGAPGWLSVTADAGGTFVLPLHRGVGTITRLFQLPSDGGLTLNVGSLDEKSPCMAIDRPRIGVAKSAADWTLHGSSRDLSSTAAFVAANATLVPNLGGQFVDKGPLPEKAPPPPEVTLSGGWTGFDVNNGAANGASLHQAGPDLDFNVRHASAEIRGMIAAMIPSAPYVLSVPVLGWNGARPRLILLSQTGAVIVDRFLQANEQNTKIEVPFVNPADSSYCSIYLSEDAIDGQAVLRVGDTLSARLHSDGRQFAYAQGSPLPRPSVAVRREDASLYEVSIQHAPPNYVLVLNNAYSEGWHAIAPVGVRARHVKANVYMNGWVIDGGGNYRLTLAYDGWNYMRLGLLLCGLLLAIAVGLHMLQRPRPIER